MALTETRPEIGTAEQTAAAPQPPTSIERLIGTGDHVTVGRLFIGFSLVLGALSAVGLALAGLDRLDDGGLIGLTAGLATSSLVALVLTGAAPLLIGLAVHIVPRQVGSPSIAFPRAAAGALWTWLIAAAIFWTSVVLDGGVGGAELEGARLGWLSMGAMMVALSLAMVCVATTVLSHRPLGMGLAKVPFFAWSMLVAAPVWIVTFGSTVAHVYLGQITGADAAGLAAAFDSGVAWFLRAPSIYMLAIPVLGIAADAVAMSAGRRIKAYGLMQGLIAAFAVLSFGVWTQDAGSLQTVLWAAYVVLAGLPILALLGGLADTVRQGRFRVGPALVAALLSLLLVLGGVATAALQALDTAGSGALFGLDTTELWWAQALFLTGAALVGAAAGLAHWSRRIWHAPGSSGAALGASLAVFAGTGLMATIHLVQAIAARDGAAGLDAAVLGGVVAAGAAVALLGILGLLAGAVGAAKVGIERPDADDDGAMTLEWYPRGPVVAGTQLDVELVRSPYPLADLAGAGSEEGTS